MGVGIGQNIPNGGMSQADSHSANHYPKEQTISQKSIKDCFDLWTTRLEQVKNSIAETKLLDNPNTSYLGVLEITEAIYEAILSSLTYYNKTEPNSVNTLAVNRILDLTDTTLSSITSNLLDPKLDSKNFPTEQAQDTLVNSPTVLNLIFEKLVKPELTLLKTPTETINYIEQLIHKSTSELGQSDNINDLELGSIIEAISKMTDSIRDFSNPWLGDLLVNILSSKVIGKLQIVNYQKEP